MVKPTRRSLLSWASYDFANTIFSAIVLTSYFPLYLTELAGKNIYLGAASSLSMILAGLIVPFLGALSDQTGKTKVYLIDKQDRILPFEDIEISNLVASNLAARGVTVHKECSLDSMKTVNGKVEYTLNTKDGKQETFTVEKALISIGRVPNAEFLDLEKAGVELNDRGFIDDDDTATVIDGSVVRCRRPSKSCSLMCVGVMK